MLRDTFRKWKELYLVSLEMKRKKPISFQVFIRTTNSY